MNSFGLVSKGKYLELEKANTELKTKITTLQKKVTELISTHGKAIDERTKMRTRYKELKGELLPLKSENSELRTNVQNLTDERILFQKLIRELTNQVQRHKKQSISTDSVSNLK